MSNRNSPTWHAEHVARQAIDASNTLSARILEEEYGGAAIDAYCIDMANIAGFLLEFTHIYRVEVVHLAGLLMEQANQEQVSIDDLMTAAMVSAQDLEAWRISQSTPEITGNNTRPRL